MKFGVREICDVVFKAKTSGDLGSYHYEAGQPVLYIDSAKTSTIEGASSTVYAQGGRGNARLIAWEGEKTLTFTVEDALLSPVGFAILSGAQILTPSSNQDKVNVHMTSVAKVGSDGSIDLSEVMKEGEEIVAPVFVIPCKGDNSLDGELIEGLTISGQTLTGAADHKGKMVFVDYYVTKTAAQVTELTIDAGHFAGNWYVEASTLFKRQEDGVDLPAEIVFPNVKIQSNFTFSMASTGDPSTFTFTMDALPGRIQGSDKRVLCSIQIIEDEAIASSDVIGSDSIGD